MYYLDAAEIGQFIDGVIDAYRRRHTIQGFRPGKAPAGVIRQRFHDEIEQAVSQELVPRKIEEALAEQKIHPAGPDVPDPLRTQPAYDLHGEGRRMAGGRAEDL